MSDLLDLLSILVVYALGVFLGWWCERGNSLAEKRDADEWKKLAFQWEAHYRRMKAQRDRDEGDWWKGKD